MYGNIKYVIFSLHFNTSSSAGAFYPKSSYSKRPRVQQSMFFSGCDLFFPSNGSTLLPLIVLSVVPVGLPVFFSYARRIMAIRDPSELAESLNLSANLSDSPQIMGFAHICVQFQQHPFMRSGWDLYPHILQVGDVRLCCNFAISRGENCLK